MSHSVHKITVTTFVLATAIIVYLAVMSYESSRNVLQTTRLVAHTHEILDNLEALQTTAGEATSAVRDYLTSSNESQLRNYAAASGQVQEILGRLRELTADDSHRQEEITTLERTLAERFARAQQAIEKLKGKGTAAVAAGGTGGSQAIREQIAGIEQQEEQLLQGRTRDVEAASERAVLLNEIFSVLALAFISVFLYRIQREFTARQQAEDALKEAHASLAASVRDLAQREKDITQLSEMGDTLQSCQRPEEAYEVISQLLPSVFPGYRGGLYVISASRNLVEGVAHWGGSQPKEAVFSPDDCWALRQGRMHIVERGTAPRCKHSSIDSPVTVCIPMVAQSDAMGVLHLEILADETAKKEIQDCLPLSQQRLAKAAAEHIALALANLKLRETLQNQSIRDPLTNLFNRRYMEESLERELSRAVRNHRPLAVVMLDIDNFKRFNDTFGHEAGDEMLRVLAYHLQTGIRFEDIACRFGGEEFVLILPDSALEDTLLAAERLREGARRLALDLHGRTIRDLSLSLGVAVFPIHGSDSETLLRVADRALYLAKRGGRDRVIVGQAAPRDIESGV